MARLPRLTVPGCLHHVVQRGHNRQPVFLDASDRQCFLTLLTELARAAHVDVHAYVLLDNHFHLLLTPGDAQGLGGLMQGLGRRYVRYFNDRHQRSGTLWDGRYRSALLQADAYGLDAMVYLDLHPVRAALAAEAHDYAWSSHRHYAGYGTDKRITALPAYWALGNTPFAREAAYVQRVRQGLSAQRRAALDQFVRGCWALGDAPFLAALQQSTAQRVSRGKPGRPRAAAS